MCSYMWEGLVSSSLMLRWQRLSLLGFWLVVCFFFPVNRNELVSCADSNQETYHWGISLHSDLMERNCRGNLLHMTDNLNIWLWSWSKYAGSPNMKNTEKNFSVENANEVDRAPFTGQSLLLGLTAMSPKSPQAPSETAKAPNIVSHVNLNTASGYFASFHSIQTQQLTSCICII